MAQWKMLIEAPGVGVNEVREFDRMDDAAFWLYDLANEHRWLEVQPVKVGNANVWLGDGFLARLEGF